GIVTVSYNVPTGWTAMRPVRTLMRLLAEAGADRSDVTLAAGFDLLEAMKNADAEMFRAHPGLAGRLAEFRGFDQRYVVHELLNRDWQPLMFDTVAAAMAEIKCDYVGSAMIPDNIAAVSI